MNQRKKKRLLPTTFCLLPRRMRGFTLIEVLIAVAIFLILTGSIFLTYGNILEILGKTRMRTVTNSLMNREIEIIRNLPFDQVGIVGGFPAGVIPAQKVEIYEGAHFLVEAYVRNVDDPFDGTASSSPKDTAPADYRLVDLKISCPTCFGLVPITFNTWVAAQQLETSSKNGSLFINVFDANGAPISGADVKVVNTSTSPTITIIDTTNNAGLLQLVDIPTSTTAYQVTVGKTGYSTSMTYQPGAPANPNPIQPHATVATQTITAMSFAIDRLSTLTVTSQDNMCGPVPSVNITQNGAKLIGSNPDVLKYFTSWSTDAAGKKVLSALESDNYTFTNTSAGYDLAGITPLSPFTINPNTSAALTLLMEPKSSTSLMVTVKTGTSTPLVDATVNITKSGVNQTKTTGEKFFTHTDWSGSQYAGQDGNIANNNPAGDINLIQSGGLYPTSTNSYLISNTVDLGTSATTFHSVSWAPASQPGNTTLKFQLASNNDNATWTYAGPDGTGSTYYTVAGAIGSMHDGHRYFRYKAYLNTVSAAATPSLSDITIGYTSDCIPAGQSFFPNLATGTYTVTVSKTGYTTATSSVSVGSGWQQTTLTLQ